MKTNFRLSLNLVDIAFWEIATNCVPTQTKGVGNHKRLFFCKVLCHPRQWIGETFHFMFQIKLWKQNWLFYRSNLPNSFSRPFQSLREMDVNYYFLCFDLPFSLYLCWWRRWRYKKNFLEVTVLRNRTNLMLETIAYFSIEQLYLRVQFCLLKRLAFASSNPPPPKVWLNRSTFKIFLNNFILHFCDFQHTFVNNTNFNNFLTNNRIKIVILLPSLCILWKLSVDVMLERKKNSCHQGSTSWPRA